VDRNAEFFLFVPWMGTQSNLETHCPVSKANMSGDSALSIQKQAVIRWGWLSELSESESATMFATFMGWTLDGMDVMVFSFVLPTLIATWHVTRGQAGLLGTSTLVISSVGGWAAGLLADRWGRVRVLKLTILWFAFFTFLSGFTNSFHELLLVRGLQGLGFGGEWAVGSVLIGETVRAQHRGKAVGVVQSGWAIGWALAALAYAVLFLVLPPELAWRVMFWIGILPALLVFYIQRHVHEPDVFEAKRKIRVSEGKSDLLQIFGPQLWRTTFLASSVALGVQGGYYAITTWLPLYLKISRGLSVLDTSTYLFVVIFGSFAGYLVSAHLTDSLGRKGTLVLFAVLSLLSVFIYTSVPISNSTMLVLGFPLGFFASGSFSPIGAFFTELFPTSVRGAAQGFSYNLGRGVGALFPALVGYMSNHITLAHAIAVFAVSAYLLMTVGVLALPETRGRELSD
jgi:MFS family permease